MTDEVGKILNRYEYDAFDNFTVKEETVTKRFCFTGEQYDPASNLYYLRARFYSPVIGRFLNEDTYYGDGLNLYAYCHNNPLTYVDQTGHWCEKKQQETVQKYKDKGYSDQDAETMANYERLREEQGVDAAEKYLQEQVRGSESGSETTRVGRWMSQDEYDKMVASGKVQMSGDNKVHVANPADINAFGKQAPEGSIYVEFDVPSNTISKGGKDGWGIINGPGSLLDRLNVKKVCLELQRCQKLLIYQSKGVSNMSDYNYEIIKASVLEWYEKVLSEFLNRDEIMLSKNNDDALIIDFDFQNCIAQLSVTNSQYVPYQFVYFEAMDIEVTDLEDITPIYSFHDDDSMQKNDVISALGEALLFCSNYKVK